MAQPFEYDYSKGDLSNIARRFSQFIAPGGLQSWSDVGRTQVAPWNPPAQPATPGVVAAPKPTAPAVPPAPITTGTAPATPKYVEDTTSSLAAFRRAQLGLNNGGGTDVVVARQPNGVLSFTAGAGGSGGVNYYGMPTWRSHAGGAGMGSADFGGEAFRPAQAAVAAAASPMGMYQTAMNNLINAPAATQGDLLRRSAMMRVLSGVGNLAATGLQGQTQTGIAKIGQQTALGTEGMRSATTERGQDVQERLGLGAQDIQAKEAAARTAQLLKLLPGQMSLQEANIQALRQGTGLVGIGAALPRGVTPNLYSPNSPLMTGLPTYGGGYATPIAGYNGMNY